MDVERFLKEQQVLRLATTGPGKTPHVVPVWYMYSAKKIYVGTSSATIHAKNIDRGKVAAFCVDVGVHSPDIRGVAGRGRASLVRDPKTVRRLARRILLRYFETVQDGQAQQLLDDTDCIIEITPGRMSKWSY